MKSLLVILAMLVVGTGSLWAVTPTSPFTECPGVDADPTGCQLLIVVTSVDGAGNATAFSVFQSTTDLGPLDGCDDTLVGILNSSGGTLKAVSINAGTGSNAFGFELDGACDGFYSPGPTAAQCPGGAFQSTDPGTYSSSNATFTNIAPTFDSGTVLVGGASGLANNGTAWFSLEEALTASQIVPGTPPTTPVPNSVMLMFVGLAALAIFYFGRHKFARAI
jgi:hypothetical protein